jgi:phage repressor protein C with HTH and peptisase S24 domain
MDVLRHTALAKHIAGGRFELAQRPRGRAEVGMVEAAQAGVGNPDPPRQRLLADMTYSLPDEGNRLVHEAHAADHKRAFARPSRHFVPEARNCDLAHLRALADNAGMSRPADKRREAIRRFMAAHGLKIKPWAKQSNVGEGSLRNFLNGRTESLTHSTLEKLAFAANATIAEMIGEMAGSPRPGKDLIAIHGLKITAGLGGGVDVSEEPLGDPVFFRKTMIERLTRGKRSQLRVIDLRGDSMEPTLFDGDRAMVDLNDVDVAGNPGVFCLWDGTGLVVKRLQLIPGERPLVRIKSDNHHYDTLDVDAQSVRVIGRVVWRSGRL